jgi:hypothetical protein
LLDFLPGHVPGPQHGQGSDDQLFAIGSGDCNRIEVETTSLRVLAMGVDRALERAPSQVAGDVEVVAGREDGGGDRRLNTLAGGY